MFLRATQTIEQSTGFSLKKNQSYSDHLVTEDFGDGDQELDKYIVLLLGLQRLLVWERTLLKDIIPPSRHTDVFSKLAQNSIDLVVKDAEVSIIKGSGYIRVFNIFYVHILVNYKSSIEEYCKKRMVSSIRDIFSS